MELDYHKAAYVIAGETREGETEYFSYDNDNRCFVWEPCVFYANLYSSLVEVETFIRGIIIDEEWHFSIKRIWVEKILTTKCEDVDELTIVKD